MQQFFEGPQGFVIRFLGLNDILKRKRSKNGNDRNRQKNKSDEEIEADKISKCVALAHSGHVGKANDKLQQVGGLITPPSAEWCMTKYPPAIPVAAPTIAVEGQPRARTRSQQQQMIQRGLQVHVEEVEKYDEERDLRLRGFTTKNIIDKIQSKRSGTAV
jgi:hypothetical protein